MVVVAEVLLDKFLFFLFGVTKGVNEFAKLDAMVEKHESNSFP